MLAGVKVGGEEVVAAVDDWAAAQQLVCEDHDDVTFCAIEGYRPWIDDWAATVDLVRDLVPVALGVDAVSQSTDASFFDTDPKVAHVGGSWDGPHSFQAGNLVIQVLAPELGLPGTAGEAAEMNTGVPECMAMAMPLLVSGQARAVGLIVLNELVVPDSLPPNPFPGRETLPVQFEQLELSRGEVELAGQILERPREDVLATLHGNWAQLVDPGTSTALLAGWFGLETPEVITESSFEAMTCTCTGDGGVECTGSGP